MQTAAGASPDGAAVRYDKLGAIPALLNCFAYLLAHANHHTSVAGTANNAREHGAWGIISGKTGLQERSQIYQYS
jgi:hypothetical protein